MRLPKKIRRQIVILAGCAALAALTLMLAVESKKIMAEWRVIGSASATIARYKEKGTLSGREYISEENLRARKLTKEGANALNAAQFRFALLLFCALPLPVIAYLTVNFALKRHFVKRMIAGAAWKKDLAKAAKPPSQTGVSSASPSQY